MHDSYSKKFEAWLRPHRNPVNAEAMEAYMRHLFPFLGIRNPERVALTKQFWKENGFPQGEEGDRMAMELWELPEREFVYTALAVLMKQRKQNDPARIDMYERLIITKSWWDSVDVIAAHLVGPYFAQYPELIPAYVERWLASDNTWLQRTALLFQLRYKERTDQQLLFTCIRRLADDKEFFIRKAIGWALRELAKTDADTVRAFVAETKLSALSVKEALKHMNRSESTGANG